MQNVFFKLNSYRPNEGFGNENWTTCKKLYI